MTSDNGIPDSYDQCEPGINRPIKQLMYMQIICYDMDENQIIACLGKFHSRAGIILFSCHVFMVTVMDLARAPRRTARKKGSGYENGLLYASKCTIC
jgi:hypothetical protein